MIPISIITATYNSAGTVRDTLESVKKQRYSPIEHIIIDGKSTDATLEIVSNYAHVSRVLSEKDGGIYDAMNKGIQLATGEVIGILNSDDVYATDHVLQQVADLFKDDSVDACYADLQYVKANDLSQVVRTWKSGSHHPKSFFYGWMPPHPTFFVRRRVYDQVGYFNLTLKSAADYELMLRIFVKHQFNIAYLPQIIVKMRTGGLSNASFKNRIRANKEDRMAWKMNGLTPYFYTLYLKPLRKLGQFLKR